MDGGRFVRRVDRPRRRRVSGGLEEALRTTMRDIVRTNDIVLISAVEALLTAAGIGCLVADAHVSALEGSIGVLPRRILVPDDDVLQARRLLSDADLGHVLYDGP